MYCSEQDNLFPPFHSPLYPLPLVYWNVGVMNVFRGYMTLVIIPQLSLFNNSDGEKMQLGCKFNV